MPTPFYRHNCIWEGGREVETYWSRCWRCLRKGEPYRWQWSVVEQWARYNWRTRLSPFHAKPPELKKLQVTRECDRCDGEGLVRGTNRRIPICPDCKGAGGFPVLSEATLQYAREYGQAAQMAKITEVHLRNAAREKEWAEAMATFVARAKARKERS